MYAYCTPHPRCTRSTFFSCFVHISFVSVLQLSVSSDTSEKHLHMSSILLEAFNVVHSELQAALHAGDGPGNSCPSGTQEHEQTMHLLEKYSEQLVQMTRNKLSQIWTRISYSGSVCTEEFGKRGPSLFQLLLEWHWAAFIQLIP